MDFSHTPSFFLIMIIVLLGIAALAILVGAVVFIFGLKDSKKVPTGMMLGCGGLVGLVMLLGVAFVFYMNVMEPHGQSYDEADAFLMNEEALDSASSLTDEIPLVATSSDSASQSSRTKDSQESPERELLPTPAEPKDSNSSDAKTGATAEVAAETENDENHPKWLHKASGWKKGVYTKVISSDPMATVQECEKQLDTTIEIAFAEYVEEKFNVNGQQMAIADMGESAQKSMASKTLRRLNWNIGGLRSTLIQESFTKDYYSENLGQTLKQVYYLLEFDKEFQKDVARRFKEYESHARNRAGEENALTLLAMGGGIFLLLGATYGLLRFDTATKGYYTKWIVLTALFVVFPMILMFAWLAD